MAEQVTIDTRTEAVEQLAINVEISVERGWSDAEVPPMLRALAAERDALKDELRARFSGLAMQGLLADSEMQSGPTDCAKIATNYADALITELLKEKRHGIDP